MFFPTTKTPARKCPPDNPLQAATPAAETNHSNCYRREETAFDFGGSTKYDCGCSCLRGAGRRHSFSCEPIAAPDGAAAVEHSDMSAVAESGEPSPNQPQRWNSSWSSTAAPHHANLKGEIESGCSGMAPSNSANFRAESVPRFLRPNPQLTRQVGSPLPPAGLDFAL